MNTPDSQIADPEAPTVDAGTAEPGSVLVELMEHCLTQLEAGQEVNRDALVAAHPELESQIDACLASLQFIHRAVQPTEGIPSRLGDFRIVREIGRGGMGVVYEAEQISLKRQVALKVLRFGAVADSEAMKRFQREAETIASLHHTNIVPVFAVGVEKSIHYYAMQLIEGRSLREISQDHPSKPIPDKTIARWGLQSAEALAHAHERGVVHRDIKPSNLILGTDDRIWLTDFGLAKRLDDVTLSLCGALLGTPRYMSPEQASALRHPVDHRTDIYSLGATLYELVTGRPLFESDSPHVVISQILTIEPKPPREIAPHVPRDLETIILKCLCKDASKRYQRARDLADDLRAFEEGRVIKARRVTAIERAGRWLKQNRRVLAATFSAVAVTMVMVLGGSAWWSQLNAALQAKLILTAKDGPLIGEVLTAGGDEAIRPFTVPNEQPVLVPEGQYQLRTVGRGALSKTGWLTLDRGPERKIAIDSERPQLYSDIPLNSIMGHEFVDFGDGPNLIVLPESPSSSDFETPGGRAKRNRLTRINGTTGQEVWSIDISQNSPALKELLPTDEIRSEWWTTTVFGWERSHESSLRVLRPLMDLDADGVPDLVWRLHQGYCLFAVSGKTGQPLWWDRTSAMPASGPSDAPPFNPAGPRRQWDAAALSTIPQPGGTSIPIVVVLELEIKDSEGNTSPARLFALDARNKRPLWSKELPGKWHKLAVTAIDISKPGAINLAVVQTHDELLTFDLRTGAPAGPTLKLPEAPQTDWPRYSSPQIVDIDSDGQPEVLLIQNEPNSQPLGLQLVSLSANGAGVDATRPNWRVPFAPRDQRVHFVEHRDLNGDGVQEILLTTDRQDFDCRVLDGRTGQEIWCRQRRSNFFAGRHSSAIIGDDLDHDGWREVFVASVDVDAVDEPSAGMSDKGHSLFVDCFSGKDGHSFWWAKTPISGKASAFLHPFAIAPRWWPHGLSGEPSLLITALVEQKFPNAQGLVFTVDALSGRFEEVASELAAIDLIDLNRDGRDELVAVKLTADDGPSHNLSEMSGELRIFQGESPTGWRRFDTWRPLMDLDGDGLSELWQPYRRYGGRLPIISGRDGKQIVDWGTNDRIRDYIPMTEPAFDLDGDGLPEVLTVTEPWSDFMHGQALPTSHELGVTLFSPRTRRRFWNAPQVARPTDPNVQQVTLQTSKPHWTDLDGDGVLEILVPYLWHTARPPEKDLEAHSQYWLAVLDARTGRMKWQVALKEEPADRNPFWNSEQDWLNSIEYGDLDGDGVQDLLLNFSAVPWHSKRKREAFAQAISGRDGHLLWPELHAHLYEPQNLSKEQQDALKKNSSLQQFISTKQGYLQTALANVDGKPGDEVIHLDFIPDPKPDRPFLDGELLLSVLEGRTGAVMFEKQWPAMVHPHDRKAPQRLLTLRRKDRDAIVVTKARFDSQYSSPGTDEDWLLALPTQSAAIANGAVPELEVTETYKMHRNDRVWKADLEGDGVDELVAWRIADPSEVKKDIVVSRGLKDALWKHPIPSQPGFSNVNLTVLESGKGLLISAAPTSFVFRSDGKLLSQFAALGDAGEVRLGCDKWISRWEANQTPRVIVTDGSQTRSDLVLAVNDQGVLQPSPSTESIKTSHRADPRSQRPLPWVRHFIALAIGMRIIVIAIGVWLMLLIPFRSSRWIWANRQRGWPLIGFAIWLIPIAWTVWFTGLLAGNGFTVRMAMVTFVPEFAVGLPLGLSSRFLWRSLQQGARSNWLWLAGTIVVATTVTIAIQLQMDAPTIYANESYGWDGWYLILLPGVCFGLWLYLILQGIKYGWQTRRASRL